jgi:hypothetical protein
MGINITPFRRRDVTHAESCRHADIKSDDGRYDGIRFTPLFTLFSSLYAIMPSYPLNK